MKTKFPFISQTHPSDRTELEELMGNKFTANILLSQTEDVDGTALEEEWMKNKIHGKHPSQPNTSFELFCQNKLGGKTFVLTANIQTVSQTNTSFQLFCQTK